MFSKNLCENLHVARLIAIDAFRNHVFSCELKEKINKIVTRKSTQLYPMSRRIFPVEKKSKPQKIKIKNYLAFFLFLFRESDFLPPPGTLTDALRAVYVTIPPFLC